MVTKRTKTKRSKSNVIPDVVKNIQPVGDVTSTLVALFYGKSGRGKTLTASTFPTPNLFLDINNEKGLKTIKNRKGVQTTRVQTWEDFEELYWWLKKKQDFKTITLDQITGLQEMAMKHVRKKLRMSDDEPFSGYKRWGALSGDMKTWLNNYRDLNELYNVVFIAHERAFSDDEADEDEIDPSIGARLMPSVGSFIDGACDVIGHCFIKSIKDKNPRSGKITRKTEYCMRLGPNAVYTTKIRRPPEAGPIPEFIINPSYQKLIAIENGEKIDEPRVKQKRKVTKKRRS